MIADLPVGNNLQDHVGTTALNFEAPGAQPLLMSKIANPLNSYLFANEGKGEYNVYIVYFYDHFMYQ